MKIIEAKCRGYLDELPMQNRKDLCLGTCQKMMTSANLGTTFFKKVFKKNFPDRF